MAPAFPERLLNDFPELDVIVRGQPEVVFMKWKDNWDNLEKVEGLAFRRDGSIVVNAAAPLPGDLDEYPFIHYDAFPRWTATASATSRRLCTRR